MFRNLKVGKKLGIGFGILLALLICVSLSNYSSFQKIKAQMALADQAEANRALIVQMEVEHLSWASGLTQLFLDETVNSVPVITNPDQSPLGIWLASAATKEMANQDSMLSSLLEKVSASNTELYASAAKIDRFWDPDDPSWQEEALQIFALDTKRLLADTHRHLAELRSLFALRAAEAQETAHSGVTGATALMVSLSMIGVAFGLGAAWYITRSITGPVTVLARAAEAISVGDIDQHIKIRSRDEIGMLAASFLNLVSYMRELAQAAQHIAANDLTAVVKPRSNKDSLGRSFATMVTSLSTMIRQIDDNARSLTSTANEIANQSAEMSSSAQRQTEQVNSVSVAIEQMAATIIEAGRSAEEATKTSQGASEFAVSGGQTVNDTIQGMGMISEVVKQSSKSITELERSADQIGEITNVINDIADQTNLLALNAAIEAARAGDQGRGFAVVADEVRKLAERTARATGEITQMIRAIQDGTHHAVESMESGIRWVDKGRELADKSGNSLHQIVAMSQQVMQMIQQMAAASEQQSTAAETISQSVEQISSGARETAAGAEQSAAAADELNQQAEGLQKMVARFKFDR